MKTKITIKVLLITLFLIQSLITYSNYEIQYKEQFFVDNSIQDIKSTLNANIEMEKKSFHLFSHGKPGELFVNDKWLNKSEIAIWLLKSNLLNNKSHLNIYGCNFAKGEKGKQAVSYLETTLGVSIAASDDITGIDGDWDLEIGTSVSAIQIPTYQSNLQYCPDVKYDVYVYYRSEANFTNNAVYRVISSLPSFDVAVDQTNHTSATYSTIDNNSQTINWTPIATGMEFNTSGEIQVRLIENLSSTASGTWIKADAILFVDEYGNEYVIDNPSATVTGSWLSHTNETGAYNKNERYIATGATGNNYVTWIFSESATSQVDSDNDGLPNECDLDADNDGIENVNECDVNSITNGDFTGAAALTGWIKTGHWFHRTSTDAYVNNNTTSTSDLSQTITVATSSAILHYDLKGFGSHARGAMIEIYVNNILVDNQSADNIVANLVSGSYHRQIPLGIDSGLTATILFRVIISSGTGSADDIGIDNIYVGACDDDKDGIPNYLDTDSDNDGCPDAVEAGHIDLNGDGKVDGTGTDTDGKVTGATTAYTGNTPGVRNVGINSACCDVSKSGHLDTDNDGVGDVCDLDHDNDGIENVNECDVNSITNGDFTGAAALTGWTATGSWFHRTSTDAYVNNNTTSTSDLSQTITVATSSAILHYDLKGFGSHARGAMIEIYVNNILVDNQSADNIVANLVSGSYHRQIPLGIDSGLTATILFRVIISAGTGSADDIGIDNIYVGACDDDKDGIPNYLDTDSDNDGCPDAVEAGHIDLNQDGIVDGSGTDTVGKVTGATTSYTGNTAAVRDIGINSACCDISKSGHLDTDNDGVGDVCDLDHDNDGIENVNECDVNSITNGDFTGAAALTGWTKTGNWFHRGNVDAYVNNNAAISSDLSQTITVTNSLALLHYDLRGNDDLARDALIEVYVNGVLVDRQSADSIVANEVSGSFHRQIILGIDSGLTATVLFRAIVAPGAGAADDVGVDNVYIGACDDDGDGIPNYLDTDSDGDGCTDAVEAGHIDLNGDGIVDGTGTDTDGKVTGATTAYTGNTAGVRDSIDNKACFPSIVQPPLVVIEDSTITFCPTITDPYTGDVLTVSTCSTPANGTATSNDTCITYTPSSNFVGMDSVCVVVCDQTGLCDSIMVPVTVTPVTDTPSIVQPPVTVVEDSVITFCPTITDPDTGDTLTVSSCSTPANGTATSNDTCITYTPNPNYNGMDSICVVVCDQTGLCDSIMVPVTVTPVTDTPSIVQPPVTVVEDSVITFCPTITDPDTGDTLTVSSCSTPANGTATSNDTCITYTPNPNYNGMDSICVVVCDQTGLCDSIMVPVTVTPVTDTPSIVQPPVTVVEDSVITFCPTITDPDTGDTLTVSSCSTPANGTATSNDTCITYTPSSNFVGMDSVCVVVCDQTGLCDPIMVPISVTPVADTPSIVQPPVTVVEDSVITFCPTITDPDTGDTLTVSTCSTPVNGTATSNDTCITYTPSSNFVGIDSVCVVVCDQTGLCDSVMVPVTVTPVTDTPSIVQPPVTVVEDSVITFCPTITDLDTGDTLTVSTCSTPVNGTATSNDTCITYTPNANYNGMDSICVVVCDQTGLCDSIMVPVTVTPVTDTPSIVQPPVTVVEDSVITFCPTITDPDTGDTLTVSSCSTPANGTATSNDTCITYTPSSNFVGIDSICVVVCDQTGLCDSVMVPVTVTPVTDTPSIVQPSVTVVEDSVFTFCPTITDPDTGDTLTVSTCSTPANGTATSNDTCITYTPSSNFVGMDSVCVVVCDQTGLCDSIMVPISVTPVADTPSIVQPPVTVVEDSVITFCPTITDPDTGDTLTVSTCSTPVNGTATSNDTCIAYTPNPNYNGMDSICVVVCDQTGLCDSVMVPVIVTPVTDTPLILQPPVTVTEGNTVTFCPTITDPDTGDTLTVSTCSTPVNGTATSNDTCITYTPNLSYNGLDSVCVVVCDQTGLCDSVMVTVTVTGISDKPSIVQPPVTVMEDSVITFCPTITDPDTGDTLTVSTCSTPVNGTATSNDTCITYTPNPNYNGMDSICVVVCDQTGLCDSIMVPISVTPVADTPSIVQPSVTVVEDSVITFCPTITDPDTGDTLTVSTCSTPANGTATSNDTCITYTPSSNFVGMDSVCVVVCDQTGLCDSIMVPISVTPVADTPSIVQPSVTVVEDSVITFCPTITDPDTGDTLTVSTCSTPANGTATSNDTCITYTPNPNYNGMDSICVVVCDQTGLCDSIMVPISVTPVADTPSIVQPSVTVVEDSVITFCPTITDPDTGDTLTVSTCSTPANGTATSNDTCITYTPSSNFVGMDSVCVVVCDQTGLCDSIMVPISVTPVTDTPLIVQPPVTVMEDSVITFCPTITDPDTGDTLTVSTCSTPANGTATSNDTCITYTPNPNYNGMDSICVVVCDQTGLCDSIMVPISVTPVADTPSIVQPSVTVVEDSVITFCPTITDPDTGDTLTVSTCSTPANGTATSNDTCITYTPSSNFVGMDSVCVVVCDQTGLCDSIMVPISVTPVTDTPLIVQPPVTVMEDSVITFCPTITDPDTGDTLTVSTCSTPVNGTATSNDTCITYTPSSNFVGIDSICVVVCDQTGLCDSVMVPISVTPVADTPTIVQPPVTVTEGNTVTFCPTITDPDTGDTLTVSTCSTPVNGTATSNDTCITYTPNLSYNGLDSVCVVVCDQTGLCDSVMVTVTVTGISDKPSIVQSPVTVAEDSMITFCPTITDPDTGDTLTVSTCSTPANGTATSNDTCITYTPNPNYNGMDSICVVVCDQTGLCDSVMVPISVTPVADTPTIVQPPVTVTEGNTVTFCPTITDPDTGDTLTVSTCSTPVNGTATSNDTCITYTPNLSYNGLDSVCVVVCDQTGLCDSVMVTVTVTGISDKPSIVQSPVTVAEDSMITFCPTITDPDTGDTLTVSTCSTPANGTATSNDTCITYTPNPNYNGMDSICVVVCDQTGLCDSIMVPISVTPVADTPSIVQPPVTVTEGNTVTFCPTITDPDTGDTLTVSTCSTPVNGTATSNDTCITYTPNLSYNGLDSVCVVVCDQTGLCDSVMVTVTVTGISDKPSIVQSPVTVAEDSMITFCPTITDPDTGDTLTVSTCSTPANGTATSNDTCITYTPNPNYNGMDSICVVVCDQTGLCDSIMVPISVTPVADTPSIVQPPVTVVEDSVITFCPTITDPDTGDTLTVSTCSTPANGTATSNDTCITYTPSSNFVGMDSVCVVVCDQTGLCDSIMVPISVTPVTDTPLIVQPPVTVMEDSVITFCPTITDPDTGDTLTVSTCSTPSNGTATSNDTCITYTPNPNYNGMDSICVVVCDQTGLCDSVMVLISVTPVADTPTIVQPPVTVTEGNTVTFCPTITDPDTGDTLIVSTCSTPVNGTATSNDTCITYTPNLSYNGLDSVCIVVCDQTGLCDSVMVLITVTPVVDTIIKIVQEDSKLTVCPPEISAVDSIRNMALSCVPNNGSTTIDTATGCVTYTPNTNYVGNDTMCIVTCDTSGICKITIVNIIVTPVIDTIMITLLQDSVITYCMDSNTNIEGGAPYFVSSCGLPDSGSIIPATGSCITYTPNSGFNGGDTTCVITCNSSGLCDITIIIYNVVSTNLKNDTIITMDTVVCLDTTELPNGFDTIMTCDGSGTTQNGNVLSIDSNGCVTIQRTSGKLIDTACIVVCDTVLGVCDTTIILFIRKSESDTIYDCIQKIGQIKNNDMNTDDLIGSNFITNFIKTSSYGLFNLYNDTSTSYQSPPLPFLDTVIVSICDEYNFCDTFTFIYIPPMNSDTLFNQGGGIVQLDTSEMPNNEYNKISTCDGLGMTSNGGSVSYLSGGRVDITPNFATSRTDTTCVVLCDTVLPMCECDTSYVINFKSTTPDTFAVVLPKTTFISDTCLTQDELSGTSFTYSRIGTASSYGVVTVTNDTCINYVQTTTKYLDTARIQICDEYGICDTTVIIYIPTPDPDTLIVGPVVTLSNVDTCVTIESTFMTGMFVGTCDGTGTSSSGVPLTLTGHCVRYPSPAAVFTGDTSCIIVCDTIHGIVICDTTMIVYLPDTTAPTVICKDDTVYLDQSGSVLIDTSNVLTSVHDNTLLNSVWITNNSFNCSNIGVNNVTVFARDTNRNMDSCTSVITVLDTIAPIVVCQNITIKLDSNGNVSITSLALDGGSSDNCGIASLLIDKYNFDCSNIGNNSVTLTVTDIHGNTSSCTAIVTVVDDIAPTTLCPQDQQISISNTTCAYIMEDYTGLVKNDDNCDSSMFTITQFPAPGTEVIIENESITVTITTTDQEGNSNSCSFEILGHCTKVLIVPQLISPNGDGQNDTWEIPELAKYPNNVVKVFNRWGNLVFEEKGYTGGWNGIANMKNGVNVLLKNSVLPEGTYFCIIDLGEKFLRPYVGYLQIRQ